MIPLWARAEENRKKTPRLEDQYACEFIQRLDYDFSKFRFARSSQLLCIERTILFDRQLRDHLLHYRNSVVVELGVGLDTRYARFKEEGLGNCLWFEIDFPDTMAVREQLFPLQGGERRLAGSFLSDAWIDEVKGAVANSGKKAMPIFLAEGVFMYCTEKEIRHFFTMTVSRFNKAVFIFDTISPAMVFLQNFHDSLKFTGAKFRWGLNKVDRLLTWNRSFSIAEVHNPFEDLSFRKQFSRPIQFLLLKPFQTRSHYKIIRLCGGGNIS
ncbi:MAG: class I SAM-dependent methyltransferase [Pirellulaceae bacterium]|nr:class I SAM-dependent methyltransferase [Pirellulaceae bacterium]